MKNRWIDTLPATDETEKLKRLVGRNHLGKIMAPLTDQEPPLLSENDFHKLAYKHGNFYSNITRDGSIKRSPQGKDFFRLTRDAMPQLQGFTGIKYQVPSLEATEGTAMGLFKPQDQTTYLSPNMPQNTDIVPLINHETQHAIEHQYPKVQNTVYNFLKNRHYHWDPERNRGQSVVPEEAIPQLYRSLQDIINFPAEFTAPYNAYTIQEDKEKGVRGRRSILDTIQHQRNTLPNTPTTLAERTLPHRLTNRFSEVPAFSVQAMSDSDHPWNIENNNDRDSLGLFKSILHDTRDQYRQLGLDRQNPERGYVYSGARDGINDTIRRVERRINTIDSPLGLGNKRRHTNDGESVSLNPNRPENFAQGGRVELTPEEARIAEVFNMTPEEYKRLQRARFGDRIS